MVQGVYVINGLIDVYKRQTYDIAQNYQQQYSDRIILLRNKTNQGLSYTLNNCLKYARGDYIARMDGDDISLPNRFEKEVNFLNMHPEYAIVSTPMIYFDENGVFRRGRGSGEPPYCQLARGTPFCHAPCMAVSYTHLDVYKRQL